jgi:hypothetical protein
MAALRPIFGGMQSIRDLYEWIRATSAEYVAWTVYEWLWAHRVAVTGFVVSVPGSLIKRAPANLRYACVGGVMMSLLILVGNLLLGTVPTPSSVSLKTAHISGTRVVIPGPPHVLSPEQTLQMLEAFYRANSAIYGKYWEAREAYIFATHQRPTLPPFVRNNPTSVQITSTQGNGDFCSQIESIARIAGFDAMCLPRTTPPPETNADATPTPTPAPALSYIVVRSPKVQEHPSMALQELKDDPGDLSEVRDYYRGQGIEDAAQSIADGLRGLGLDVRRSTHSKPGDNPDAVCIDLGSIAPWRK